jgi:membrane-associated protease RseP (regulator of RpoE activity)
LQHDDLLTSVNGKPIHSLDDMASVLQQLPAGAKVTFEVQRDGKSQTAVVTLGKRPSADQRKFQNFGRQPSGQADQLAPDQQFGQPSIDQPPLGSTMDMRSPMPTRSYGPSASGIAPPPLLGVRTNNVTEQDRARLGLSSTSGAHVIARTRGSAAEKANIPLDAVIVAVNGQAVSSPNDLSALLAQADGGSTIELTYLYNRQPTTARVTLSTLPQAGPMSTAGGWPPAGGADTGSFSRDMARPQYRGMPMNPGGTTNSAGPMSSPPMPGDQTHPPGDAERIEMLERRVRELEQRVKVLEDRAQRQA